MPQMQLKFVVKMKEAECIPLTTII